MKTCIVDKCDKDYYAKGFCSKHYQRVKKHGTPLKPVLSPLSGLPSMKGRPDIIIGSVDVFPETIL